MSLDEGLRWTIRSFRGGTGLADKWRSAPQDDVDTHRGLRGSALRLPGRGRYQARLYSHGPRQFRRVIDGCSPGGFRAPNAPGSCDSTHHHALWPLTFRPQIAGPHPMSCPASSPRGHQLRVRLTTCIGGDASWPSTNQRWVELAVCAWHVPDLLSSTQPGFAPRAGSARQPARRHRPGTVPIPIEHPRPVCVPAENRDSGEPSPRGAHHASDAR